MAELKLVEQIDERLTVVERRVNQLDKLPDKIETLSVKVHVCEMRCADIKDEQKTITRKIDTITEKIERLSDSIHANATNLTEIIGRFRGAQILLTTIASLSAILGVIVALYVASK